MADYLRYGRPEIDLKPFVSTQTGNFDLYLPFIERGLALLNENGRLGFIAPSLWTVNEYGQALRSLVSSTRSLEKWIDFRAYQVFEEATTYTGLMFFTKTPNVRVKIVSAPDGVIPENAIANDNSALPYERLAFGDRWLMITGPERDLIDRLASSCSALGHSENTSNIFVGLQTSADSIYHLQRLGPGRYRSFADSTQKDGYEVEIEDALMKPLVSGAEAKRYISPSTSIYLLFPYDLRGSVRLIPSERMEQDFPKAWRYLRSWEKELRRREARIDKQSGDFERDFSGEPINAPFNDDSWYRFGRHQNLDKQNVPKLIVAQTVPRLRVCFDEQGANYLNNVRVNGILPAQGGDPWWLLGILNASVADFVFRRIAKVKDGNFYEANRQFIAPLPIPCATDVEKAQVAALARGLQKRHSRRRDLLNLIARRMATLKHRSMPETWLFPEVKSKSDWEREAPANLDSAEKRAWAKAKYDDAVAAAEEIVGERLKPGVAMDASFNNGELSFSIDGVSVIDRIFLDEGTGAFTLAQWKVLAATFAVTEKVTGKKLCSALRKLAKPDGSDATNQIGNLQRELATLDASIAAQEADLDETIYELYRLTDAERALIERG